MAREILQRGLSISEISFKHSTIQESKYKLMTIIGCHLLSFPATRAKNEKANKSQILICGVLLFLFFLIWAELSVEIIGKLLAPQSTCSSRVKYICTGYRTKNLERKSGLTAISAFASFLARNSDYINKKEG